MNTFLLTGQFEESEMFVWLHNIADNETLNNINYAPLFSSVTFSNPVAMRSNAILINPHSSAKRLKTKLYDKRDDFSFPIVNCPFLSSNILSSTCIRGMYLPIDTIFPCLYFLSLFS